MITMQSSICGISLARQRNRRWVVAVLWCGVIPLLCAGVQLFLIRPQDANSFVLQCAMWAVFWVAAALGGVRAGGWVKPFRAQTRRREVIQPLFSSPDPTLSELVAQDLAMDERETTRRDRIHYLAYSIVQIAAYALFLIYLLLGLWKQEFLGRFGPMFLFLLTLMLWSLPQSIILWTEPDMEESE